MRILHGTEAQDIRNIFLSAFIDTASSYYQSNIANMAQFSDGICYTGYLWDCLIKKELVSYHNAVNWLEERPGSVYILWDIHSCDRIRIPDYWKYPKDSVLYINAAEIPTAIPTLPEDCYFFDESLSWALAFTHEERKPGKRLCFMCMPQDNWAALLL